MFHEFKHCPKINVDEIKEPNRIITGYQPKESTIDPNAPPPNIESSIVKPHIKDSGERRQFETGAVRDIQEGKGRCDLLPLDVVAVICDTENYRADPIIDYIDKFIRTGSRDHLYHALKDSAIRMWGNSRYTMFLEVSKHFEEGAKKYGEYNWQKGIPTHCYIDSAVRHYLKYLRGDTDEPHDRAFVWNILCCIWTCKHKPELNDYAVKEEN